MDIGARLQDAREAAGLTQEQLARKVKVTRQAISKIENTGRVSLDLLARLAKVLAVGPEDLVRGKETKP